MSGFTVYEITHLVTNSTNIFTTAQVLHTSESELLKFCRIFDVPIPHTEYKTFLDRDELANDLKTMGVHAIAQKRGVGVKIVQREIERHGLTARGIGERISNNFEP